MTVSVLMLTYNHEKYIAQAVEGVMMQKVDFDFELIIGDDCSTDKTTKIIQGYKNKFPDIIKPILRTENIGAGNNYVDINKKAKGKYIAHCEGDDYWTDPNKLQKQVDFLEANPEYVLCSHNGTILDEIGTGQTGKKLIKTDTDYEFNTEDLLISNRASTLTVMFRGGIVTKFPDWYTTFTGGDRSLYIILSQYGKLKHLEFDGAVYRKHNSGATATLKTKLNKQKTCPVEHFPFYLETLNKYLEYKYENRINTLKKSYYRRIFLYHFALKNYKKTKNMMLKGEINWNLMETLKDKIKYIYIRFFIL